MAGDDTNLRLFALFIAIYQHDLRTNSGDFPVSGGSAAYRSGRVAELLQRGVLRSRTYA